MCVITNALSHSKHFQDFYTLKPHLTPHIITMSNPVGDVIEFNSEFVGNNYL